jgi:hypothetical protein
LYLRKIDRWGDLGLEALPKSTSVKEFFDCSLAAYAYTHMPAEEMENKTVLSVSIMHEAKTKWADDKDLCSPKLFFVDYKTTTC